MNISTYETHYNVPTTWITSQDNRPEDHPTVSIGSFHRPVLDVIADNKSLVYLSVLTAGTNSNTQEAKSIRAELDSMREKKRKSTSIVVHGSVQPTLNGSYAPDEKHASHTSNNYNKPLNVTLYLHPESEWGTYKCEMHPLPAVQSIQMHYYAFDKLNDSHGYWIIPLTMPLAQRQQQLRLEILRRCPTITIHADWAEWLYTYLRTRQYDPKDQSYITMVRSITSYGQYQGFCLNIEEEMLEKAITTAFLEGKLAVTSERKFAHV